MEGKPVRSLLTSQPTKACPLHPNQFGQVCPSCTISLINYLPVQFKQVLAAWMDWPKSSLA